MINNDTISSGSEEEELVEVRLRDLRRVARVDGAIAPALDPHLLGRRWREDDVLHVVTTVIHLEPNGRRRGRVTWNRRLVNQDGLVVQEGVLLSLVACKSASLHRNLNASTNLAGLEPSQNG